MRKEIDTLKALLNKQDDSSVLERVSCLTYARLIQINASTCNLRTSLSVWMQRVVLQPIVKKWKGLKSRLNIFSFGRRRHFMVHKT